MYDTRNANQDDIQEIVSLGGDVDQDHLEIVKRAIDSGNCWISGRSSAIEAFIVLGRRSFFQRDFVQLLFVKSSARRRGMASALFETVESVASTDTLFTSTNESNTEMQALLTKRGYAIAGIINHLDPDDPEIIFVKQMK
jgi:ribosomal protein S18 acetylase RimI-like enzyme